MAFYAPESQALVIATQQHIHHLIRELQLVYMNSLLDLLDGQLDVRHVVFVRLISSLIVLFLRTSIAFCKRQADKRGPLRRRPCESVE